MDPYRDSEVKLISKERDDLKKEVEHYSRLYSSANETICRMQDAARGKASSSGGLGIVLSAAAIIFCFGFLMGSNSTAQ